MPHVFTTAFEGRLVLGCRVPPLKRDPDTGCLLWQGRVTDQGYAVQGKPARLMHRESYRVMVAPIPHGFQVDHVYERGCRWRHCIEPTHLEAVSMEENQRRRLVAYYDGFRWRHRDAESRCGLAPACGCAEQCFRDRYAAGMRRN